MICSGITGFTDIKLLDSIKPVNFKDFKAACYSVSQYHHLQIRNIEPFGVTPNFHRAHFSHHDFRTWVLCNSNFPIVAFSNGSNNWFDREFIDLPEIGKTFSSFGYQIATVRELERYLQQKDWDLLDPAEIKAVKCWRPQTVGELVFHCFD